MTIDAITDIVSIGTIEMEQKSKRIMTTIPVQKSTARAIVALGKMGDTYDSVILRLLNGSNPGREGETHEDRGDARDESTGVGHHQEG